MDDKNPEKRECKRFIVPGATASFEIKGSREEFSPILDISRGGLKFMSKKAVEMNKELALKISIPGERTPLTLLGMVKWVSFDEGKKKYQIGVQFNPYGEKKGQNYPGTLVKIIALEQKFSTAGKENIEKYEID
jgi:hypothetical protein